MGGDGKSFNGDGDSLQDLKNEPTVNVGGNILHLWRLGSLKKSNNVAALIKTSLNESNQY